MTADGLSVLGFLLVARAWKGAISSKPLKTRHVPSSKVPEGSPKSPMCRARTERAEANHNRISLRFAAFPSAAVGV